MSWRAMISPTSFLQFLLDTRDKEITRIEQSRSALLFLLGEAISRKDYREQHRLENLLQDDTNRSLAASLRQQRPKKNSSSARSCRAATPKSAATKGGGA